MLFAEVGQGFVHFHRIINKVLNLAAFDPGFLFLLPSFTFLF